METSMENKTELFAKFDELDQGKRCLEMTSLAGQFKFLYDEWCKERGHKPYRL